MFAALSLESGRVTKHARLRMKQRFGADLTDEVWAEVVGAAAKGTLSSVEGGRRGSRTLELPLEIGGEVAIAWIVWCDKSIVTVLCPSGENFSGVSFELGLAERLARRLAEAEDLNRRFAARLKAVLVEAGAEGLGDDPADIVEAAAAVLEAL